MLPLVVGPVDPKEPVTPSTGSAPRWPRTRPGRRPSSSALHEVYRGPVGLPRSANLDRLRSHASGTRRRHAEYYASHHLWISPRDLAGPIAGAGRGFVRPQSTATTASLALPSGIPRRSTLPTDGKTDPAARRPTTGTVLRSSLTGPLTLSAAAQTSKLTGAMDEKESIDPRRRALGEQHLRWR